MSCPACPAVSCRVLPCSACFFFLHRTCTARCSPSQGVEPPGIGQPTNRSITVGGGGGSGKRAQDAGPPRFARFGALFGASSWGPRLKRPKGWGLEQPAPPHLPWRNLRGPFGTQLGKAGNGGGKILSRPQMQAPWGPDRRICRQANRWQHLASVGRGTIIIRLIHPRGHGAAMHHPSDGSLPSTLAIGGLHSA